MKKSAKSCSSLCKICLEIEASHFSERGRVVKLSHATLSHLVTGGRTHEKSLEDCGWLNPGESSVIIDFTVEMGHQFPLSHQHLKEHVDMVCRACHSLRLNFSDTSTGVSLTWT